MTVVTHVVSVAADDEPDAPVGRVVLKSAPRIKSVYWCDFWKDALQPEFYKKRPVVVVSRNNHLYSPVMVVPLTRKIQEGNKWAFKLSRNPNIMKHSEESWVVCNHIYTVSCARLEQMHGQAPKIDQSDFDKLVRILFKSMPNPPEN